MKVILSTAEGHQHAPLEPRFGRCAFFLTIDLDTGERQVFPNPAVDAAGGAGVQAAQFVIDQKPDAVVSGNFGPNAFEVLERAGIAMYSFRDAKDIPEVLERLKSGELPRVQSPTRGTGMGSRWGSRK